MFPVHSIKDGVCACRDGADCVRGPGKHPMTRNGCKDATAEAGQVGQWWTTHSDANIGVATGPESGIFVVDLDGEAAFEDLARREVEFGPLPRTVTARTGKGEHRYYRYPAGRTVGNKTKLDGKPIDIRGTGGYVIAPPSNHLSGKDYAWEVSPADGGHPEVAHRDEEGGRHDVAVRLIGAELGRGWNRWTYSTSPMCGPRSTSRR